MIRTLCTLRPGTKQDGTQCLRGELARSLVMVAPDGTEREYPAGTGLMLVKNARDGGYRLLAMLDDEPAPDALVAFEAERAECAESTDWSQPF